MDASPGFALHLLVAAAVSVNPGSSRWGSETAGTTDIAVRGAVIPTGFTDGKYTVLVQIAAAGAPLGGAAWRLAAEHVSVGRKKGTLEGKVEVAEANTPAVVEVETTLSPGVHQLSFDGEDSAGGQRGTWKLELSLPDPAERLATISPIAIVQPVAAMFARGGQVRPRGALARVAGETVRAELPAALVSVVCRGPSLGGSLDVERALAGNAQVRFETVVLPADGEACAQVRDLIPPGAMSDGHFRYEVRILASGRQVAAEAREFHAEAARAAR
jgi:hypothetical protein